MATSAKPSAWRAVLKGAVAALALHLGAQLLISALTVNGVLAERFVYPVQAVVCGLAALVGCVYAAGHTPWGTLYGALITGAVFAAVLLLLGFLVCNQIDWTGKGGGLLASILCGAVAAGLLGSRGGKRKKRRKKSRG